MIPFLVAFIVVLAIVLFAQAASKKQTELRRNAMAQLAANLGLVYVPISEPQGCLTFGASSMFLDPVTLRSGRTEQIIELFQAFSPFGTGSSRRIDNLIMGPKDDNQWMIFDYQYTVSSGKSSTTYRFGIIAVMMPLAMPSLQIRPAGFLDTVSSWLGSKDIQFESEEFNREFTVNCSEAKLAYDIVDPQMMEYLMSIPRYSFQFLGNLGVVSISGTLDPAQYYRAAGDLDGFLQRIPNFVRQDIGYLPTWPIEPP